MPAKPRLLHHFFPEMAWTQPLSPTKNAPKITPRFCAPHHTPDRPPSFTKSLLTTSRLHSPGKCIHGGPPTLQVHKRRKKEGTRGIARRGGTLHVPIRPNQA